MTSQSDVFERMFSMNFEEGRIGILKITDTSAQVIESLLQFLYLGTVENLTAVAPGLFVVADKYSIVDLKVILKWIL